MFCSAVFTKRTRIFIVGFLNKNSEFVYPKPTFKKTKVEDFLDLYPNKEYVISDLLWKSHKKRKLRSFQNINRTTLGTILFPLGFIIIASLFWEHKHSIACSFMILAVSDPLSSLTGENIKKPHNYNIWKDVKSYEG